MQIKIFKEYEQCTMCLKHAFKTNKQTKKQTWWFTLMIPALKRQRETNL